MRFLIRTCCLGVTLLSYGEAMAALETQEKLLGQSAFSSSFHKIISASAGFDQMKTGKAQSLTLVSPYENYYTVKHTHHSLAFGGLFGGIEYWNKPEFGVQLGLGGYINSNVNVNGTIWQFGMPEFANLNYSYQLQTERLMVESKLLTTVRERFHPYVSGGLGISSNKLSGYQEKALIDEAVPMSPFAEHDHSSFAWEIGAGLDMNICPSVRVGVGYQYVALGDFSLGLSNAQQTEQRLSIHNVGAHEFRAQLTFIL